MIVICLSTYNGAYFLKEQLQSIEEQSCDLSHVLLLVRDDGSSDESYTILEDFAHKSSLHVKLLEDRTNLGVKKSFELLMLKALDLETDYIMFCDQDDIWLRHKLAKTYTKMQKVENEYSKLPLLIHSDLSVVDKDLHVRANSFWQHQHITPNKMSLHNFLVDNNITGCTMMINRALAEKVKVIPQEAIMHDWWIALVASVFGKIDYIDEPLMLYRQHSTNDTGAKHYGLHYAIKKLFQNPSFEKYTIQSKAFLEMYEKDLDDKEKEMFQSFSNFHNLNKVRKVMLLFRYKIWKNGFLRNIGLVLFA